MVYGMVLWLGPTVFSPKNVHAYALSGDSLPASIHVACLSSFGWQHCRAVILDCFGLSNYLNLVRVDTLFGVKSPRAAGSVCRGTRLFCYPTIQYFFATRRSNNGRFERQQRRPWKTSWVGYQWVWKRWTALSTCIKMPSYEIVLLSLLCIGNGKRLTRMFGPTVYPWNNLPVLAKRCLPNSASLMLTLLRAKFLPPGSLLSHTNVRCGSYSMFLEQFVSTSSLYWIVHSEESSSSLWEVVLTA